MYWVVRGHFEQGGALEELRKAMRSADPAAPVTDLRPVEQTIAASVAARRFNLRVLAVFAAAALLLSAAGIYAMLSYAVSQRTREFAIRSALGAGRNDILTLVVRQGLTPALSGIVLGLAGAFAITRTLSSMLFGLSAADPATFAVASLGLLCVALSACLGPGLRASRAAAQGVEGRTF
jgi:putative ABC transport system permease protein